MLISNAHDSTAALAFFNAVKYMEEIPLLIIECVLTAVSLNNEAQPMVKVEIRPAESVYVTPMKRVPLDFFNEWPDQWRFGQDCVKPFRFAMIGDEINQHTLRFWADQMMTQFWGIKRLSESGSIANHDYFVPATAYPDPGIK